jgi:plastocyanin
MNRLLSTALIAAAILALAGCSAASSAGTAKPSIDPNALTISAKDLKFSISTLPARAGKPFQIAFDNQDSAPHNVAIYRDSSAAEKVFGSDPFSGPAVVRYDVPPLAPGSYFFRCDVHPAMSGELTVN